MHEGHEDAAQTLSQILGYGIEEEDRYMVVSTKRWHTFMRRPADPSSDYPSLFLSKQFDSREQVKPSRRKAGGLTLKAVERGSITMEEAVQLGRHHVVRRGVYGAQKAIYKVWEVGDTDDAADACQELYREAAAYDALEGIQGDRIPRLLGRGLLHGATMAFLATSAGQCDLADLDLTEDICNAARETLAAFHSLGWLHGDISLENFILRPDGKGVWAIDLGHSCALVDTFHAEREKQDLDALLQDALPVNASSS
ncbi:hypothetical protein WJX73_004691 [Symbiochloris irregularis]|uniref:Protein kinase domain-containing protein n=1 Tax=Symbiochloris irregularis TaxID=706552 RepID=A0AAW1Q2D3_9CHLO